MGTSLVITAPGARLRLPSSVTRMGLSASSGASIVPPVTVTSPTIRMLFTSSSARASWSSWKLETSAAPAQTSSARAAMGRAPRISTADSRAASHFLACFILVPPFLLCGCLPNSCIAFSYYNATYCFRQVPHWIN